MIAAREILSEIRSLYDGGATQQEISDLTGVSRSYVRDLLSGKRSVDGLTVKKLNQLFPNATLSIGNRTIGDNNVIHARARVQSDNNFLPADGDAVEHFRRKILDCIIACEEISDEERGKFLRIIRGVGK